MMLSLDDICRELTGSPKSAPIRRALRAGYLEGLVRLEAHGRTRRWQAQPDALPAIREAVMAWQREAYPSGEYGPYVDPEPVRAWIRSKLPWAGSLRYLASEMQIDERRLYSWMKQVGGIPYLVLENALWNYDNLTVEQIVPEDAITIHNPVRNGRKKSRE